MAMKARVKKLVVDTAPLLRGEVSHLLAEEFYTIPRVFDEVRDERSRCALESLSFSIVQRAPTPEAIRRVIAFGRETGDFCSLSTTDLGLLALTYMLHAEEYGADSIPLHPNAVKVQMGAKTGAQKSKSKGRLAFGLLPGMVTGNESDENDDEKEDDDEERDDGGAGDESGNKDESPAAANGLLNEDPRGTGEEPLPTKEGIAGAPTEKDRSSAAGSSDESDDSSGWITPQNIKALKTPHYGGETLLEGEEITMVSCMTSDFAMQNVLLQMKMNVHTTNGMRVKHLRTFVLRCHACYHVEKDVSRRFCSSCGGGDTLLKTTANIDASGNVHCYLKKHFRHRIRGTIYPIPPIATGHGNKKAAAGPQKTLILREDQKEFQDALRRWNRNMRKLQKSQDSAGGAADLDALTSLFAAGASTKTRPSELPVYGYGRRNPAEAKGRRRR